MTIASSAFDSIHLRPAHVYNRASLELLLAILFDQKFVVPTASIIDSPVVHSVIGDFLKAQEAYGIETITPLELRVDPSKHFHVSETKHVMFDAADAYLCGRAQSGRDLAADHPGKYPLPHRFSFIQEEQLEGRKRDTVLKGLRKRNWKIFEEFNPYFLDHAQCLNRYFERNPNQVQPVTDLFVRGSYESYLMPSLNRYSQELHKLGIGDYEQALASIIDKTQRSGAFTRNQLYVRGAEVLGAAWDRYFMPMINHHYWELLAKLMASDNASNIEMGEGLDPTVASAIVYAMPISQPRVGAQLRFAQDGDDFSLDGYSSPDRAPIDWRPVIRLRSSSEFRNNLKTIRQSSSRKERDKAVLKHIDFISRNLGPMFNLEQDEMGSFTVQFGRGERNYKKIIVLLRNSIPVLTTSSAAYGAYYDGAAGAAIGAGIGAIAGKAAETFQSVFDRAYDRKTWRSLISLDTLTAR